MKRPEPLNLSGLHFKVCECCDPPSWIVKFRQANRDVFDELSPDEARSLRDFLLAAYPLNLGGGQNVKKPDPPEPDFARNATSTCTRQDDAWQCCLCEEKKIPWGATCCPVCSHKRCWVK